MRSHKRFMLRPLHAIRPPGPSDGMLGVDPFADALSIAMPQLPPCDGSQKGPEEHLSHHNRPGRVYPNYHRCPPPDQIAHFPVVPIDHPGIASHKLGYNAAQLGNGDFRPVGTVVNGVQFDAGNT